MLRKNGSHLILGEGFTIQNNSNSKSFTAIKKADTGEETTVTITSNKDENVLTAQNPIDFDHAMSKLTDYAKTLQQQADTADLVQDSGNTNRFTVKSGTTQIDGNNVRVVSIGIDILTNSSCSGRDIIFENLGNAVEKVLVNVTGLENLGANDTQNIWANNRANDNQDDWTSHNSNLLFNFGDYAGTLDFRNKAWYGSVLAPMANVLMCSQQAPFNGKVIANSVTRGKNEQHDAGSNWNPKGEVKPDPKKPNPEKPNPSEEKPENPKPSEDTPTQQVKDIDEELVVIMTINAEDTQHQTTSQKDTFNIADFSQSFFTKKAPKQEDPEPTDPKTDEPEEPTPDPKKDEPENPEPSEPTQPTDSTDEDEPTPDSKENKPSKPGKPSKPSKPATPLTPEKTEPAQPVTPTHPADEVEPTPAPEATDPTPETPEVVFEVPGNNEFVRSMGLNYRFHLAQTGAATNTMAEPAAVSYTASVSPAAQARLKLADTQFKRSKGAHTASATGMWGYASAMVAAAGLGILSLLKLKSHKN